MEGSADYKQSGIVADRAGAISKDGRGKPRGWRVREGWVGTPQGRGQLLEVGCGRRDRPPWGLPTASWALRHLKGRADCKRWEMVAGRADGVNKEGWSMQEKTTGG